MVNLNIKTLLTQVKKLREQYESKKSYIKLEQQNLELIRKQISSVQEKIDNFGKDKETIISEHAILRYLERVKGLDIEEIKKEILTEEVKEIIKVLGGNGKIPNNEFKLVLKDNIVTTIVN